MSTMAWYDIYQIKIKLSACVLYLLLLLLLHILYTHNILYHTKSYSTYSQIHSLLSLLPRLIFFFSESQSLLFHLIDSPGSVEVSSHDHLYLISDPPTLYGTLWKKFITQLTDLFFLITRSTKFILLYISK